MILITKLVHYFICRIIGDYMLNRSATFHEHEETKTEEAFAVIVDDFLDQT